MRRALNQGLLALSIGLATVSVARAGMPSVSLSDVPSLRLQVISFFLLGLLASSAVVWWIWNSLAKDFVRLPRLSFAKACGVVILWGLLFVVVLTMISGARELMTPGAWEKDGVTYKLRDPAPASTVTDPESNQLLVVRQEHLHRLAAALALYAASHERQFPASATELSEDVMLWQVPVVRDEKYLYRPGLSVEGPPRPLVYEPECFDGDVLVLFTDMNVRVMAVNELREVLRREGS